ncbi:hypothetical protein ACE3MZ_01120 [Paenibacillus sp. WLX1005]
MSQPIMERRWSKQSWLDATVDLVLSFPSLIYRGLAVALCWLFG